MAQGAHKKGNEEVSEEVVLRQKQSERKRKKSKYL